MNAARAAAAVAIIAAGVTGVPQLAGATCGHPGQPEWCPALTTTTTVPTTTSTAPVTTTTTSVPSPTTTEAVLGDVIVDIGTAISITRSPGATPVKVNVPKLAG